MKHPKWCEEDECENGFHSSSASFGSYAGSRIQFRLRQDIKDSHLEVDIGEPMRMSDSGYSVSQGTDDFKNTVKEIREFHDHLKELLAALEAK
jgi:hypothetical protein